MSVKMRKIVENEICTAVVDALLKAKFLIQVENGEPELRIKRGNCVRPL